jgi:hypothetical protein
MKKMKVIGKVEVADFQGLVAAVQWSVLHNR